MVQVIVGAEYKYFCIKLLSLLFFFCEPEKTSLTFSKMVVLRWNVNWDKKFSTSSNCNKHEKSKYFDRILIKDTLRSILFDTSRQSCTCPTPKCSTSSKYKYSIVKHLKSFYEICKKSKGPTDNKVCKMCKIIFTKKSDCDRHICQFHVPWLPTWSDSFE